MRIPEFLMQPEIKNDAIRSQCENLVGIHLFQIYMLIPQIFFFAQQKHPVPAARGAATHLPKEGAQGACMNSHAVGPRST